MEDALSLSARKELLGCIRNQYQKAAWKEKRKLLDGFISTTGYKRKYAIFLLNGTEARKSKSSTRRKPPIYHEGVYQALVTIWYAANQICSKRLVPFIPTLVHKLESLGHLSLSPEVKASLLKVSAATVDRLLKRERLKKGGALPTTRQGNLLKKHIQVKTFTLWDETKPGFLEVDCVSHCGGNTEGSFLHTLVLTDIASTWTECLPLLRKCQGDVIAALQVVRSLLPFPLRGIDSDNGTEFINYKLLNFCESNKITFTRSRAYRKNDQAHVEEKNGSIVRKLIGYDRYEGLHAWKALGKLYAVLRLYLNFFQPSMKLVSKERQGSKLRKKYDQAQTPYQRLLTSLYISEEDREKLKKRYQKLDPIKLLKEIESLQHQFWHYAWKEKGESPERNAVPLRENSKRCYRRTLKPRKPRTWRTRKDNFETVWPTLSLRLDMDPHLTAKGLLKELVEKDPDHFNMKQLRTLQYRVAAWRKNNLGYAAETRAAGRSIHYLGLASSAAEE